jgi:hypothetical protein
LYKCDFGYSVSAHSGLERTVPNNFLGVTAVDLTPPDSSSLSFDYIFRLQTEKGSGQFYWQSEMNYSYKKTRQVSTSKSFSNATCSSLLDTAQGCGDRYVRMRPRTSLMTNLAGRIAVPTLPTLPSR